MMTITEEQRILQNMAAQFAKKEVAPLANRIDHDENLPDNLVASTAAAGFYGLCIAEEFGGAGAGLTSACMVLEEIAKASPSFAGLLNVQMVLCPLTIDALGSDAQKRRWLPSLASGERLLAYSQTEPAGAANVAAHLTRLTADGNAFRLNGAKLFCTQGTAKTYLVMCKTARGDEEGYACVVVDRDAPGMTVAPYEDKLGWRGTNTGGISFDDVEVAPENVLGDILTGALDHHMRANQASFMGHAATSIGCAQGMFDQTLAQVKERRLYGEPMHKLQPVSYWLAESYMKLEAMRALLYASTRAYDAGEMTGPAGSICKSWICNTAFECTNTLLQLWGGSGIINSTGVNRYMRDARTNMIAEGTSEMHASIIASMVLGLA